MTDSPQPATAEPDAPSPPATDPPREPGPAPGAEGVAVPRTPESFPEVWSRRHDLPGLPWCLAKGVAKGVVLFFFLALVPIEFLTAAAGATDLMLQHSFSVELLAYGGTALALTSGGFTAFQTTRAYGVFRFANRLVKLVYQYLLATVAIITLGPFALSAAGGTVALGIHFDFADIFYLFMIPTTIALLAAVVTLYEDATRPGERLPWDFPISRRTRREREAAMAAHLGIPPPP